MDKVYRENSIEVLRDATKLTAFVNEVLNGEHAYFWNSVKAKKLKYSKKVVGKDFE